MRYVQSVTSEKTGPPIDASFVSNIIQSFFPIIQSFIYRIYSADPADLLKEDILLQIQISQTFSARTNPKSKISTIDLKFERRLKGLSELLDRKKAIILFDDVNIPFQEVFGAQPPMELLDQCFDHGGRYDRNYSNFTS
jgi:hypothetical protein